MAATPQKRTPVAPGDLSALYRAFAARQADLDYEGNVGRINFRGVMDTMNRRKRDSNRNLAANMADRGMTHAGAHATKKLELADAYNKTGVNSRAQLNALLSNIKRKKTEATADYREQKELLRKPPPTTI